MNLFKKLLTFFKKEELGNEIFHFKQTVNESKKYLENKKIVSIDKYDYIKLEKNNLKDLKLEKKVKIYFSKVSKIHRNNKINYPMGLYEYLNSINPRKETALDFTSHNIQVYNCLKIDYANVLAVGNKFSENDLDLKYNQILHYTEKNIKPNTVDLITLGSSIYNFDRSKLFKEFRRVMKANGKVAIWTRNSAIEVSKIIDNEAINFSQKHLNNCFEEFNSYDSYFDKIEFPFDIFISPDFYIKKYWTLEKYLNYVYDINNFNVSDKEFKVNLIDNFKKIIQKHWNSEEEKEVKWKIKIKVGVLKNIQI